MKTMRYPRFVVATHVVGILVTLLLHPSRAAATALVGLIDAQAQTIIVAADGMITSKIGAGPSAVITHGKTCKILDFPQCVAGVSGHISETGRHFNLQQLAANACGHSGDLRSKATYFLKVAQQPITEDIEYLRKNRPDYYREQMVEARGEIMNVLLAGIQEGHLTIFVNTVLVSNDGATTIKTTELNDQNPDFRYTFAGSNSGILAYIKDHPDWERELNATTARTFIEIEIADHPDKVGPPISILEIYHSLLSVDPNRIVMHWVERGACDRNDSQNPGQ